MQAADEEELVHLQNLLTQSQAAEAEAVRQAGEATQKVSASSVQHVCQVESDLQQVCNLVMKSGKPSAAGLHGSFEHLSAWHSKACLP